MMEGSDWQELWDGDFRDKENQPIEKWNSLHRLKTVIPPQDYPLRN